MTAKSPYVLRDRDFTAAEVRGMAELHATEIRTGFLSSLGPGPLQLLYGFAAESGQSVLLGAFGPNEARPLGLIWGTLDCPALYREFLKRKGFQALRVFLPRLLSWRRMTKAIETLFYPAKEEFSVLPKAEILNFAVRSESQGTGLAQELFSQLAERLKARGVSQMKMVTSEEQKRAQRFYEKMGARQVGLTSVHKGHKDLVYVYEIG